MKVVESVRPYHGSSSAPSPADEEPEPPAAPSRPPPPPVVRPAAKGHGSTLDGSWDRRLARGLVQPDTVLDLHGHNLATAYDLLDARLEAAIASGARMLLLITGNAPRPGAGGGPYGRGRIRAAMGDWLAASRHASDIAAVRGAHLRHGGGGALYIILRKRR